MKCKICENEIREVFTEQILNKYSVKYFLCDNCEFLSTEEPYWLEEAYNSPINKADTGILWRNTTLSKQVSLILYYFFDKNAKFLDFAGGYGIFVRLMRDIGFDYYWSDIYCQNLLARGFEYSEKEKYEVITSFETFEHFANPIQEIEKMLSLSDTIILSQELKPSLLPAPKDWWYYIFDGGQHVSFYSLRTFHFIADKYNLNYYNIGWLHLLTRKKIDKKYLRLIKYLNKFNIMDNFQKYKFDEIQKIMQSKMQSDMDFIRVGLK
ncbi:MAG: type 11 methyltransferase [Candidatus Peregrinibacteria bacterium GW2011_GWC2_33_13]|nr:MAG: type 11 methyltransferase [Candidatus Peregrinibacteria bacterium GW2011_GWC2_33_13]